MLSFGPQYYSHIYIWFIAILSLFVFNKYAQYSSRRLAKDTDQSTFWGLIIAIVVALFVGLRPVSEAYFVDMANYSAALSFYSGEYFSFNWSTDNIIFDNFLLFYASKSLPEEVFFLSISAIYFFCMVWACSSLFPRDKIAAFLVCLGAFSTFSYATNGMKAGAAASIFLVSIALYEKRRLLWALVFAIISMGFHHSMVVPVASLVICHFVKNPRVFYATWGFAFLMALFHITYFQQIFAWLADEQGASYLIGSDDFIRKDIFGGFRIDFILYSAAPIIFGWIGVFKKRLTSRNYSFLLNLYLLTNAIWLLCMYAEFTNRIAYLSWFMLPIVLIYPLLNEKWGIKQYQTFRWVALGHLGFTLFMQYIFY